VQQDGVQIVEGLQCSCVAPAVVPYLISSKIPTIIDNAGTTALTQGMRSKYVFRTAYTNPQQNLPMGAYAVNTLGYKNMIIVSLDYSAGYENAAAMANVFEEAGGNVVTTIYVPEDATDMAPYITKLLTYSGKADSVDAILFGAPAVGFVNEAEQLGLDSKMGVMCLGCSLDGIYLPSEGANAAGLTTYGNYFPGIDLPANTAFLTAYKAATGQAANLSQEAGYVGAEAVGAGILAAGGNVGPQGSDQTAFLNAERIIDIQSPQGPLKYDDYQNAVITVWIAKAQQVNGQWQNVITGSVPNVGQYYPGTTP
jgi:ABC-type branched-subunit amino acid transport system substrate-binding protein